MPGGLLALRQPSSFDTEGRLRFQHYETLFAAVCHVLALSELELLDFLLAVGLEYCRFRLPLLRSPQYVRAFFLFWIRLQPRLHGDSFKAEDAAPCPPDPSTLSSVDPSALVNRLPTTTIPARALNRSAYQEMEMFMNKLCKAVCALAVTLALAGNSTGQTLEDVQRIAPGVVADSVLGYIYGYPLLMYGVTGRTANSVPDSMTKLGAAPVNQFGKEMVLPNATFTTVVLPSTSTLYASSFLNLCQEPVVLHLPNMSGRFFLMQMLDGWTEVSAQSPGTRAGSPEGDYVLIGPDCQGHQQPPITGNFVDTIRMPTSSMWIIGRIYTSGTDADLNYIKTSIYPGLTLTPWSKYVPGGTYTPPDTLSVQAFGDVTTPPVRQVDGMEACAFYANLASMLTFNPPVPGQDDLAVRALARLGVVPGQAFDCTTLRDNKLANIQNGLVLAKKILDNVPATRPTRTGWTVSLDVGNYGASYLLRAEVAREALGANRAVDAVYGYTQTDGRGLALHGSRNYVIHFAKPGVNQGIPPVSSKAFWSLTIYDADGKLVPSPDASVQWNAVGVPNVQQHAPCFNNDGSLDLYLQPAAPTDTKQKCNWLPTPPKSGYIAFLRLYMPDQVVLDGNWIPAPIQRN